MDTRTTRRIANGVAAVYRANAATPYDASTYDKASTELDDAIREWCHARVAGLEKFVLRAPTGAPVRTVMEALIDQAHQTLFESYCGPTAVSPTEITYALRRILKDFLEGF